MTPQERRKWLEDIERRLGVGPGVSRIFLRATNGTWIGGAPADDADPNGYEVLELDFVEPGEVRAPEPEPGPVLH